MGHMTIHDESGEVSKPFRVLHMEDDVGLARLLQRRLPRGRYDVALAADGERGIAMFETGMYDLLLVDYHMPVYNGLEVIRTLAARGPLPPTIMITGAGDERLATEAMKLGASDYVVKDPDGGYLELIASVMERALANHRLKEEKKRAVEALRDREEQLRKAHEELELRVRKRTQELAASNEKLRREIQVRQRAETELRASEERFRAIFETAQDCIFVKDLALRYKQVNPAMEKLFGLRARQIIGTTDATLFGEEASRHLEEVDRRVLNGEFIEQTNTRPVRKDLITFHDIRVPLRDTSGKIIGLCGISRDVTGLKGPEPHAPATGEEWQSPAMKDTVAKALMAAETDTTVLFLGESGSGKDYLARYVHDHSKRRTGPFFAVNCAAVTAELAEPELFGHEAGAFTGAGGRKRGLLELAEGGTLLLNEIAELPLSLQAKLLTFLDTRSFTRVGGETQVRVNARLIAATNCDLHKKVREGRFRLDLFYRLNVFNITVPPLRDRVQDLPLLIRRIIDKLAAEMQLHEKPFVDAAAMRGLSAYHWPGNVRELRNVIERALILSRGHGNRITFGPLGADEPTQTGGSFTVTFDHGRSVNQVADEVKRSLITDALARSNGNKQGAARMLGISRYALFRMMKALDMGEP